MPTSIYQRVKKWRARHPEKVQAANKKYNRAHSEMKRVKNREYRMRLKYPLPLPRVEEIPEWY